MLPFFDDQFAAIEYKGTSFEDVTIFAQKDTEVTCKTGKMISTSSKMMHDHKMTNVFINVLSTCVLVVLEKELIGDVHVRVLFYKNKRKSLKQSKWKIASCTLCMF